MTRSWVAQVVVMPKAGVNDPEGEAILGGLHDLGYRTVSRVRAGRQFRVEIDAATADEARQKVADLSSKLLANPVIQTFEIDSLEPVATFMENGR